MKTMTTTTTTMIKQCLTRGSHRRPASDSPDNRQLVSCNCRQGSLQSLFPNASPRPHAFLHSCHFCVMNRRLKQLLYARMELQLKQRLSMAWRWGWRLCMGMAMVMCKGGVDWLPLWVMGVMPGICLLAALHCRHPTLFFTRHNSEQHTTCALWVFSFKSRGKLCKLCGWKESSLSFEETTSSFH